MAKKDKKEKKKLKVDSKRIQSVLIVAKQNSVGIKAAKKVESLLLGKVKEIHFDSSTSIRLRKRGASIRKFRGDLVITLGGDGTFLWTAHKSDLPILPVKLEGQGFLCTMNLKQFAENLDKILRKEFEIIERMRLSCTKVSQSTIQKYIEIIRPTQYPLALNEIAFGRKRPSKVLEIEYKVDGIVFDMIGDGVMFATPSGSTAYHSSAGGAMIDPSLKMISIVPLYPFFSKLKPMIVPQDKKIEVTIRGGDCALVIDGHGGDYVKKNSTFVIETARPVKVVSLVPQNFYEKVRKNLIG
jgi:NAD+ kinase